jgi:hypothetical protein
MNSQWDIIPLLTNATRYPYLSKQISGGIKPLYINYSSVSDPRKQLSNLNLSIMWNGIVIKKIRA